MSNAQDILAEIHSRLVPECVRVEKMPNGLAFMLSLHPKFPDPKVFGTVTLDTRFPTSDLPVQMLCVEFIVFQELPSPLPEETPFRLHDLNTLALFGTLSVNKERQLCYRHTCTVNGYNSTQTAELFELLSYEMLLFLNSHYEYLLVCVTEPERLSPAEYLQYLASVAESNP